MSYDPQSREDILRHAMLLLGRSLKELYPERDNAYEGRGRLGVCVEEMHFNYSPNSTAAPDFPDAGVELKCTPLKRDRDGSLVSKERLVLNIIDYVSEGSVNDFEESSFWKKNRLLLLLFYLHESDRCFWDFIFEIVRYWSFPAEDLKIIRDDWETIHGKIVAGQAHTLSEGDTLYLGACTKGSRGGANPRIQFVEGAPRADQRAYSLKSKYINTIILDALSHPEMLGSRAFLSPRRRERIQQERSRIESIVRSINDYMEGETFEQLIERKFSPYYGHTIREIETELGVQISSHPKAISMSVIRAILGVTTRKISEFEKADIQQKSIRLEPNGSLREAMSFSQIKYNDLMEEECWEDSVWHNTLTKRFLFVIFKKNTDGDDMNASLEKVFFWTMPHQDLELAKDFWKDTRDKVRGGIFNEFMTSSSGNICHVRPKARNARDRMPTRSGEQPKMAYWLNREYILRIISSQIGMTTGTVTD